MDRRTFSKYLAGSALAPLAMTVGRALGRPPRGMARGSVAPIVGSNPIGMLFSGGGLGSSRVYENFPIFKNRVRESGGFATPASGSVPAALTSAGWPAADFQVELWAVGSSASFPSWLSGTFTCGFIGNGTETIVGRGCTVSNIVRGFSGAYTTFQVSGITTTCAFVITGTTGGATNVFAYLPAYPGSVIDNPCTAAAFTNEAIAFYAQFDHIQLEWPTNAWNNSQMMTSALRQAALSPWSTSTPNAQTFGNGRAGKLSGTFATAPAAGTGGSTTLVSWPWGAGTYLFVLSNSAGQGIECVVGSGTNPTVSWTATVTGTPGTSFSYGVEGVPIEWFIALAIAANTGLLINMPIFEDGTNGAAGTYCGAVMSLIELAIQQNPLWTGNVTFEPLGNEPWNSGSGLTYRFLNQNYPSGPYGYASINQYIGYRLHAFAQVGRATFGALWGTRVGSLFGWQVGGSNGLYSTLSYMVSQGWTPNADITCGAIAPYLTPTGLTTSSTVAQIEAAIAAQGPTTPTAVANQSENSAIMLLHYGIPMWSYETNVEWSNSGYAGMTNLAAAINDPGYVAPLEAYIAACLNSGYQKLSWSTDGLTTTTLPGGNNGGLEIGNGSIYSTFFTSPPPIMQALKSFMPGGANYPFVPTRNVINGRGSIIQGGNWADQINAANPGFPAGTFSKQYGSPYYPLQGYIGYLFNCLAPLTYLLELVMTGSGTPQTNVEIGSFPAGFSIPITNFTLAAGTNSLGNIAISQGVGYILFGNGGAQSSLLIDQIEFN